jgi:SOS-response transcriptional repressor LexA
MLGERIKLIRENEGLSQKAFGEKLGIPQTTYANYESNKAKVPDEIKQQLADLGINLHWFITGEGSMYMDPDRIQEEKSAVIEVEDPLTTYLSPNGRELVKCEHMDEIEIPILAQRLSAGPGQEWLDTDFTKEKLPLLARFVKPYPRALVFAAEVRGDSMTGIQMFDGDIAFFVRGEVEGDGIYAIAVDGEVYIKRVEVDPFEKTLTIRSENARYQPKIVAQDRVILLGKIIGWLHHHPY